MLQQRLEFHFCQNKCSSNLLGVKQAKHFRLELTAWQRRFPNKYACLQWKTVDTAQSYLYLDSVIATSCWSLPSALPVLRRLIIIGILLLYFGQICFSELYVVLSYYKWSPPKAVPPDCLRQNNWSPLGPSTAP